MDQQSPEEKIVSLIDTMDVQNIELAFILAESEKIEMKNILDKNYKFSWFTQYVNLTKNTLFEQFLEFLELEELKVSNQKLEKLPKEIGYLHSLKYLDLSNNCLNDLPEKIECLVNLQKINLSNNHFKKYPSSLYSFLLEEILMENNPLEETKDRIPEDYIDFLHWFKQETENVWGKYPGEWFYEAKWKPLTEQEILEVEQKYNIKFSYQHKEFLKVLHTIDRKKPCEWYDENNVRQVYYEHFCYNWKKDDNKIRECLKYPYPSPKEKYIEKSKLKEWYEKAPKLLPIYGHRLVESEPHDAVESPVLSVMPHDVVVYGWDLKNYLINEFSGWLNFDDYHYCNDDEEWYSKEYNEYITKEYKRNKKKKASCWVS